MAKKPIRILLIDDDRVDQMAAARHVQKHNLPYELQQVGSLAEGRQRLQDSVFDLVLLDYVLGDGTGLDLLDELGDTPAILMTGAGNEEIAVETMRHGAYDYLIKDADRKYLDILPSIIENVVARKRGEKTIRENEVRYRTLFEAANDAIFIFDGERFVDFNAAALKMFDCSREQLFEKTPDGLSPPRQPDGRRSEKEARKRIRRALAGESQCFDWRHTRFDGTPFEAEVSLTRVELSGEVFLQAMVRDITDRKRAERELKDYATALESANRTLEELHKMAQIAARAKSAFLANMSHEIRTPLTAIIGFAETLLTEGDITEAPPQRIEAINTIIRNGRHLQQIIADILDLSKIEADKLEVERIAFSPAQLVADVEQMMRIRADARKLPLLVEYAGPIPETIQNDPTRLRQILINLLGNAIKFTNDGSVRLILQMAEQSKDGPMLQFEVVDTGIGMTADEIAKLFQPFHQADNSTTRRFGGTGLGLAICKRLSEKLGGTIGVESRPGHGSTFRVCISTGSLDGVAMLENPAEGVTTTPEPVDDLASHGGNLELDTRVLLVEDAPDVQRLISFMLTKAGAEVVTAENGQIGVELATAAWKSGCPFDVILMDMQMPVLDGYQATGKLRAEGYPGPIVALTAHTMAGQRQECLDAGCDDYVAKPIKLHQLLGVVEQYAGKSTARPATGED